MKPLALVALFALAMSARASEVTLTWNPSPDAAAGYVLYAATNTFTGTNQAQAIVRFDVGTNLLATVQTTNAARWFFAATAYDSNRVEGALSRELMILYPRPPDSVGILAAEHSPTLTGTNWHDVGFFRVRLTAP